MALKELKVISFWILNLVYNLCSYIIKDEEWIRDGLNVIPFLNPSVKLSQFIDISFADDKRALTFTLFKAINQNSILSSMHCNLC